jgi:hypothetical protein
VPNWISNTVHVTGDADSARELRVLMTTADSKFDFNAVLPMPSELARSESSTVCETAWQLKYGDWTEIKHHYGPGQFASRERAMQAARASDYWGKMSSGNRSDRPYAPRYFDDLADSIQKLVIEHGFPDWYQWAIACWGTKWPAVDAGWMGPARAEKRDADQVAYFKTANSPPVKVILELSRQFPNITVRLDYHESSCDGGIEGFVSAQSGVVIAEKHGEWDALNESIMISHDCRRLGDQTVYIGHERPADDDGKALPRSVWANPFALCECSREEAASRYRRWLEGDADVLKELPPGEWPLPDVYSVRSVFLGKIIACDCGGCGGSLFGSSRGKSRCPAEVLVDLIFSCDSEDESLAEDERDTSSPRTSDLAMNAAGISRLRKL